jgi:hypothetical protein
MDTQFLYLALCLSTIIVVTIISVISFKGFTAWLTLKHAELDMHRQATDAPSPNMTNRIEIANLKERLRKLEAIASGVDL